METSYRNRLQEPFMAKLGSRLTLGCIVTMAARIVCMKSSEEFQFETRMMPKKRQQENCEHG